MICRLEAAVLLPVALLHALLARLARPAAPRPRVLACGPSRAARAAAVAPPPGGPASLTCEGGGLLAAATVAQLRALARARGLRGMGSARRATLLEVLR